MTRLQEQYEEALRENVTLRRERDQAFTAGHAAGQADMRERAAIAQANGETIRALPIAPAGTKPGGAG